MHPVPHGTVTAAAVTPVLADLLGYQFEVAPMLLAIISCVIVRVYKGAKAKTREGWVVDVAISLLSVLFTVAMIITLRPGLLLAAVLGTGLGAIGAGLIAYAEKRARQALGEELDRTLTPAAIAGRSVRRAYPVPSDQDPNLIPGLTELDKHP